MSDPGPKPVIPYWHLWTDEHGVIEFPAGWCTLDAKDETLTLSRDGSRVASA